MENAREEKVRQRVIDEAETLFFTAGFSAVTMDDLAAKLGMSKKTFYKLFASKQDLLRGVMRKMIAEVEAATDRVFEDPSLGFLEKLNQIVSLIGLYVMRLRQPILDDIRRNAMEVWEEFDAWRQERVLGKFGALIRQGMAEGFIRNDLDPQLLTIIHATLIRRVMNPETLADLPLSANQAFAILLTVFFEGILTAEARTHYREPGDLLRKTANSLPFLRAQPPREES